jgi:hypothetical protein
LGSFGTTSCTAISAPRYFLKTLTFKRNPIVTDTTPRLALPLLAAAKAQKHVTHNEALVRLDQILHLSVKSRLAPMPPGDPAENEKHIVADAAGGAFAGQSGKIACFTSGAWDFIAPSDGWLAWVEDDAALVAYHAGAWVSAGTAAALSTLGIMQCRHDQPACGLEPRHPSQPCRHRPSPEDKQGRGRKHRKRGAPGWLSGRAEFGLSGDDRFSIKVSPDGINWTEALSIDNDTGVVSLPATGAPGGGAEAVAVGENLLINGGFALNQRAFAGGSLAAGSYGFDRWKAGAAGANLSRSGDTLTLASGSIIQVVEPAIFGFGDIANETLTISLDHVSGAAVTLSVFGENRIIDTAGGRSSASFQVPGGHGGTVEVTLAAMSGAAGVARIKMEIGPAPTPYQARPLPLEETLAHRYFKHIEGPIALFLYAQAYGNYFFNSLPTPVTMRTVPTVSRVIGAYGNIFGNDPAQAVATATSPTAFRLSIRANAAGECYANFDSISLDAEL